ncbi:MutS family DNA mismatch repair protein [Nibrella saemangeumensis]|uniref:MutS family DNA mismatch repair protein n=1 Tax=Nibrella saemangeumensis TaxID=1084526 RepID=A0ABP8NNU4_9BACT
MTPTTLFPQRQQQFAQQQQAAQQRYNQLAITRLFWFVMAVALVWWLGSTGQSTWAWIVAGVGLTGFLYLLKKHQTVRRERDYAGHLQFINQDEAGRLDRKYLREETGGQFSNPLHPYTSDLDVFGPHSLFRLLNRTHTYIGQRTLAQWLQQPAPPETIRFRQQAVAELAPQLDWRQDFEAAAYLNPGAGQSPEPLLAWATEPVAPLPGYLHIVRWVLPMVTVGLIGLWLAGMVPGVAVLASLFIHGLVLRQTAKRAQAVSEQTFEMVQGLDTFRDMLRLMESRSAEAVQWRQLQRDLTTDGEPASAAISQLHRLTDNLNFRRNIYFTLFFGVIMLWDIHCLISLDRWRQRYGPHLPQWLQALAEAEALNSLAGLTFAHPEYTVPDIRDTGVVLEARQAAHPLINPAKAVANSLALTGSGQTILITGSNMSGKSTFLRTLGANVVLALAGSVVCAEGFACSPLRVFTSMRTQDSLEESTSSFYAELKRLQTLIQLTAQTDSLPVLYFLDEILKGTNSADRHRGAEALIRQLHRTTASGFVSTHDLELGQVGEEVDFITNYHFQSDLHNGELVFDYRLRPGICQSFNASQLMQAIGIRIELSQQ